LVLVTARVAESLYLTGTSVVADGSNAAGRVHLLARRRGTALT
jgi:hypothetical protein